MCVFVCREMKVCIRESLQNKIDKKKLIFISNLSLSIRMLKPKTIENVKIPSCFIIWFFLN